MLLKVDEYIKIDNQKEWIEIQKYLFNLGYKWCDNTQNIITHSKYKYPDYILIEINHLNENDNLMFSYGHIPYQDSIVHTANKINKIIRKDKINKINKINKWK